MKIWSILILSLIITTTCYSNTAIDPEHNFSIYHDRSLKEPINEHLIINDVINWFKNEVSQITVIVEKKNNYISVLYTFIEKKSLGTLELFYDRHDECKHIILKMCINGTPKTYEDTEAKRMMLAFLNYNDEFLYYEQEN